MTRRWAPLTAVVACLLLAACDAPLAAAPVAEPTAAPSTPPTPSPSAARGVERGATFRYAIDEPGGIVPGRVVDPSGLVVVDAVFDSLTVVTAEGDVRPSAAVSWRPDAALQVWSFRLRAGATFHDGSPVHAEDFVRSWTDAVRHPGGAGYHLRDVAGYDDLVSGGTDRLAGVTALDARTLEVRLSAPFADFPTVAGHPALGPVPRHLADGAGFADEPVGNGPFRMVGPWARGQFVRVARVAPPQDRRAPADGGVPLAEVLFQVFDPEAAYIAFQQGRLDFAPLPPAAVDQARERYERASGGTDGPGVLDGPTGQVYFLGFDERVPPFDDLRVRRAVSLAIDRRALADEVGEGGARPALRLVPAGLPDARRTACDTCVADPGEARRLFAEADVDRVELWLNRGGGHERVAEVLRRQLARVGVRLVLRTPPDPPATEPPLSSYLGVLRSGEAGLYRFGWTVEHLTLDDALTPLVTSAAADAVTVPGRVGGNYGQYRRADVDALVAEARSTAGPRERRRRYRAVEDLAVDRDQMFVPLLSYSHTAVVGERVRGFVLGPLRLPDLTEVGLVPDSG